MSNREFWFYGDGIDLCHFEDFGTPTQYEKLLKDVRENELNLPNPLSCFQDDDGDHAIVVSPYEISPLEGAARLEQLEFYTKESLAEMLFEALNPTYLDKDEYCFVEELDLPLSDEAFKAAFVKTISGCFSYLELCHYA